MNSVAIRWAKAMARAVLPARSWQQLKQLKRGRKPARFGNLRRLTPVSTVGGFDRGQPIDRYFIERFLREHASDIQGHVLEMKDATYTRKFGGDRVSLSDVLCVSEHNPHATIVADLTRPSAIPPETFDCIIFTQTLQMIYDFQSALRNLYLILKPGGVLLITSHGISKIFRDEGVDPWGEYWHFTSQSLRKLLAESFPGSTAEMYAYGNVLSAIAFLHGLAADELLPTELDTFDPSYEVIIAARVVKTPVSAPSISPSEI